MGNGGLQREPNIHGSFFPPAVCIPTSRIQKGEDLAGGEGVLKISTDGSQAKGIEREKVSDEEVTAPLLN